MATSDIFIIQNELYKAMELEAKLRAQHAMAQASIERLQSMIEELTRPTPPEEPLQTLRFTTTNSQPIFDQAAECLALLCARQDIKPKDTLPMNATLPLRTTLLENGVPVGLGEIQASSFWMKVRNYCAGLGKPGLSGRGDPTKITKTQAFLHELNPTDEQLQEAYLYYSKRLVREV